MNIPRTYIQSAGAVLLACATVLVISLRSAIPNLPLHPLPDPVFSLGLPTLFWILCGIMLAMALFCLLFKQTAQQLMLILWLAVSLTVYLVGLRWSGVSGGFQGYLDDITNAFGLRHDTAYWLLKGTILYLLAGSSVSLLLWWSEASKVYLKTVCARCGGHIAFVPQNLGRQIPCPHCRADIILRKAENLRMSCFFCKGHIEFPAHAVGEKIKCPHCKMDITLKEAATS